MRLDSHYHIKILAALLVAEYVAIVVLRQLGWLNSASLLYRCAALAVSAAPVVFAAMLLFGRRLQFSMRGLLAATTLTALLLMVVGVPIRNAIEARRLTRLLMIAKAEVVVGDPSAVAWTLGRISRAPVQRDPRADLPTWLEPLAGDALDVSPAAHVTSIAFNSDEQIAIFVENPERFINLHAASVDVRGAPHTLKQLLTALQRVPSLRQLTVVGPVTLETISLLPAVELLRLEETAYSLDRPPAALTLTAKHFAALASLPHLKALLVTGHDIRSRDAVPLTTSRSIALIRFSGLVTPLFSIGGLREQMPNCEITLK